MAIEREYDVYQPVCDYCGEVLCGSYSFDDAVEEMRAAGWMSSYIDGCWENACPKCWNSMHGAAADFAGVRGS